MSGGGQTCASWGLGEEIEATVTPCAAGRYWAHFTLHGSPIGGSPFAIAVRPAAACASTVELWGEGLSAAVAGVPSYFALQLRDAHGNPTSDGLEGITMRVQGPAAAARQDRSSGGDEADGQADAGAGGSGVEWSLHVPATGGGEIQAASPGKQQQQAPLAPPPGMLSGVWRSLCAGRHHVHLQLHGEPLPGSPFAVGVRGGPTHASSSTLIREGGGGRFAAIGELVVVRILARDRWGNVRGEGGEDFHIFVRGAARPGTQEMEDLGGGEYELRLKFTLSGEYAVHIAHSQMPLRGSPLKLTVAAP